MQLTLKEVEQWLSQMVAFMFDLYKSGDKEKSLELIEFLLSLLLKIENKPLRKLPYINLFISVSILDFINLVLQQRDFYTLNKVLELIHNILQNKFNNLVKILFYSSSLETAEEKDVEKKRVLILNDLYDNILKLSPKDYNRLFFLFLNYTYTDTDFIKGYLIPSLIDFYKKNRNSILKEEFLKRILQNTLWLLPRKDKIAYKLKQEIILELGKELIYNLWLEDFVYFLKLIKNYSLYSDEDFYYSLIIIWGIYTFYLLTEEDKLYPADKKKILLENLPTLEIDDDFSKRTFSQELESALEHIWGILNDKFLSLEEVIKKFNDSHLPKWEIYPEFGGKWVKMESTIEEFFLFSLITPIGNYWVEKIINKTNSQHLILKLISLIDLNDSIGIYKTFKGSFKKYTTLIGYSLEIPKISSFYFLPKKEEGKLRKLENLKRKINDILRLSLKRFIELDLEESIKNLNSQKLKINFEEWKKSCQKIEESCEVEYKPFYEIFIITKSSLNNTLIGIPSKEHCLKMHICKLSKEECKELFLDKVAGMQLLNRQQTLGELYPNLLKELFEELLTQNEEFKAKLKEWCSKERKLILHFWKTPIILRFQIYETLQGIRLKQK